MAVVDPRDEPAPRSEAAILLAECLDSHDGERPGRLEQLCREHPAHAAALRKLYLRLDDLGLIDEPMAWQAPPERLGSYRLLETIGAGGMGTIYLAEHAELGRRVALKVIHAAMAHVPRARERFRREALAASRLDNPAICTVYEVGSADGVPFLAMQHVAGEPLDRKLVRGRAAGRTIVELPQSPEHAGGADVDAVLRFVEVLALALHTAHEAGLVHRDVKPGNVMVTPAGEPVLLDFGLVRLEDSDGPGLSMSGDRLGTPLYMAPEQVAGGGATVDRRADVYSLGVLLYECLTLRPPFEAVSREQLFRQILRDEPPDARKHNRLIHRDLGTVLQTAMAKEPARRYATAQALAEDLQRVRHRQPIAARHIGRLLRMRLFAQRNPLAAAFVVLLTIALIGATVLLQQRSRALTNAEAIGLARRAAEVGRDAPQLGLHLALLAVDAETNLETVSELYSAVIGSRERRRLIGHEMPLWGAEFSPTGDRIVTWADGKAARLWTRPGDLLRELRTDKAVWSAEFARDGSERIVTSSHSGVAKIWNRDGNELVALDHAAWVLWAGFSCNGERVLTTCRDGKCYVWDSRTGDLVGEPFDKHQGRLHHGAWSPMDPDLVATCVDYELNPTDTDRFEVLVWRPSSGVVVAEILDHTASVHWLEFAPDGRSLLTASSDGTARISDLEGNPLAVLRGHRSGIPQARFSPDGKRVVTAGEDRTVRLWNRSGQLLAMARHDGVVIDARFVDDGDRILTASFDNTARLFDLQMNELLVFRGHSDRVWMAAISPDGNQIVTASWDQTARIWDLQDRDLPRLFHGDRVTGLALRGEGVLTSVSDDGSLRLTDLVTLESTPVPIAPRPMTVRVSDDGAKALVGHVDAVCRLYDLDDGGTIVELPHSKAMHSTAVFLADGRVVTGGRGKHLVVWSPGGDRIGTLGQENPSYVYALDTAPRAGLIVAGDWDGYLRILDDRVVADERATRARWLAHDDFVNAVAFSPTEDRVASGSSDRTVAIWTLDGTEQQRLLGHDGKVLGLAWSPDGKLLASGAADGTARLWRVSDGETLAVLRGHRGPVNAVLFTPDGRVWTAGDDGAVQAWPVPRGATTHRALADRLIELASDRTGQELTAAERQRLTSR